MRNGIVWWRRAVAAGCAAQALACGRDEREQPPPAPALPGPAAPGAGAPFPSGPTDAGTAEAAPARAAGAPVADPGALADLEARLGPQAAPADPDALLDAIARVGASGDPHAIALLESLVLDTGRDDAVHARAAASLARVDAEAAAATIARLDPWVISAALDRVRAIPFAESEALFRALLDAPISLDAKRDAIAALADSSPDAAPLLVEIAGHAPDPVLRATAVDAIEFMPELGAAPVALLELPAREPAPEVRASLYRVIARNASAFAPAIAADGLLPPVLAERDPAVQLEGYALVAQILRTGGAAGLREPYERLMVPWLEREALRGPSRTARLRAVEALALPGSAPAADALARLAGSSEPEVAEAARRALSGP